MKHLFVTVILVTYALFCQAQQPKSLLWEMDYLSGFTAPYALDERPGIPADTNLIAIWKMKEDADEHNYLVVERYTTNEFVFTYMNRGGSNRTYENFRMFFSKVDNVHFINVGIYNSEKSRREYFFAKVTDLDARGWSMTLWLVTDPAIRNMTSSKALRYFLAKNANNAAIYAKPVHMQKKLPLMYCK